MSASTDEIVAKTFHAKTRNDGLLTRQDWLSWSGYWAIHVSALAVFFIPFQWELAALAAASFWIRMFGITAGYHRYFAHRGYRTSRATQTVLAWLGCAAFQKGPLWWAGGHRHHHRFSDTENDLHSPRAGFWHAHQGWIFEDRWGGTPDELIRDFTRYPELCWLNRWHIVPPVLLAGLCWLAAGWSGVAWGFSAATVLLWHATYSINSLAHVWGSRRYPTKDDSRNNLALALLTLGEGWHNNHHHFMGSARNGFYWWEIDVTYYILRALAAVGLVWDLKEVPARVRAAR